MNDDKDKPPEIRNLDLFGQKKEQNKTISKAVSNNEGLQIMNRILEMGRDLEEKMSYIKEQGKHLHINTELFFNSSFSGISNEDLLAYKYSEKALLDHLQKDFAVKPKENIPQKETDPTKTAAANEKMSKDRKNKLRGMRNKWIPLQ